MRTKYIVSCLILCILCTILIECCLMPGKNPDSRQELADVSAKRSRGSSTAFSIDRTNCGKTSASYQTSYRTVTQGREAHYSEFPWLASIQTKRLTYYEPKCAGSIISYRYILTAAHCFYNWPDSMKMTSKQIRNSMRVVVGTANLNASSDYGTQVRRIKHAWLRKKFDETDYSHKYDIAIVKLKTALNYFDCSTICPICLPDPMIRYPKTIVLAGWGDKWGPYGTKLYKLSLSIATNKECDIVLQHLNVHLISSQMCSISAKHSSCIDDVGGPGMVLVGGRMHLIGIVSYHNLCHGGAVIYTKVIKYMKWIQKVVRKMENGKAPPK